MHPFSTPMHTPSFAIHREPQYPGKRNALLRTILSLRCVRGIACLALAWLVATVPAAMAQVTRYAYSNFAGLVGGPGSINGTGSAARFNFPSGAAVDAAGNVYAADTGNHTIRKITPAGVVTTFAGTAGSSGSIDATGTAARFNNPQGVAVDSTGILYVADTGNHTIRKITPAGVVTTLAGSAGISGSADGLGTGARFYLPSGVAVDTAFNVYVADTRNYTIRKITAVGVVTTIAGSAGNVGSADAVAGPGSAARFNNPEGLAVDTAGKVFVADTGNHTIREITAGGFVITLAGTAGTPGNLDGAAAFALFNAPQGIAVDTAGGLFIADTANHRIRRLTAGAVTPIAGSTTGAAGANDGTGTAAEFYHPDGLAVDGAGANVYVADTFNLTIRKVTVAGVTTTLAGMSGGTGIADGSGTEARFNNPLSVATDTAGNSYVADTGNHTIRMITPAGLVTTLAGTAGVFGSNDATGTAATFFSPSGVAVDTNFNVYVADTGNHTIRMIAPGGVVTTVAGTAGFSGSANGTGGVARFNAPQGVAVDGAGNMYVADTGNHLIRKITPAGTASTVTGTTGVAGSRDGVKTGGTASGSLTSIAGFPAGRTVIGISGTDVPTGPALTVLAGDLVTFAGDANTYVVSRGTANVKGGTAAGGMTIGGEVAGSTFIPTSGTAGNGSILVGDFVTFAGDPNSYGVTTGTPDVTGGGTGSFIVIASPGLRQATPGTGAVISVVGGSFALAAPGLLQAIPTTKTVITIVSPAQFNSPQGIAVDVPGNLYVADTNNNTIRKITAAGAVTTLAGRAGTSGTTDGTGSTAQFKNPRGVALDAVGNLYVADTGNYTIRKISPAGVVLTIGGNPGTLGSADGAGFAARFYNPSGVALDSSNNIFVADTRNNRISRGTPFLAFSKKGNTDINGDGSDDLVFQNDPGQVAVWYMNGGGAVTAAAYIYNGGLGDWRVVGVADMNNDGNADILFQNTVGQVAVWYMNGGGGTYSTAFIYSSSLGDWRVVGVADMNNDGNADILFQNTVGQVAVWYSAAANSAAFISSGALGDWRVRGVADINNDGNADILFQNTAGQVAVWYMNGAGALSAAAFIYSGGLGDWKIR